MKLKNKGEDYSSVKRGQVTIFVIIGILIVISALLIYYFYPQIKMNVTGHPINPSSYLQSCIEEDLENNLEVISAQGGSMNPEHYFLYKNEKIEYLCYTNEYYKTCVMQQALLKRNIEKEIANSLESKAEECLNSLLETYEKSGYEVNAERGKITIELLPERIILDFNTILTLSKEDSQRYNSLKISVENNLYELVSIASSILSFETSYGDSETTIYMNYYHDLKVEKIKQGEGSKIYILTDRNNGNKFQFATRSLVWPPSY
jgi:hypothetical protein